MAGTLETLLLRIRDGVAGADEIEQARALVQGDARLPEELRTVALTDLDDLEGDAAGLLSVLGADDLFGSLLRQAVAAEVAEPDPADLLEEEDDGWRDIAEALVAGLRSVAEGVEVADAVMRRVAGADWVWGPTLRDAVASEAGVVDVAASVLASVEDGTPLGLLVADAVRAEAGGVDVVAAVAAELDLGGSLPIADAVRAEAGRIEIAGAVVEALGLGAAVRVDLAVRAEAGSVDVAQSVAQRLELPVLPVAEAVHAEAGTVDVAAAVMGALELSVLPVAEAVRAEAGTVDVTAAVMGELGETGAEVVPLRPAAATPAAPPALPAAANDNRGWTWGALALAAVALVIVGGTQLFGSSGTTEPEREPVMFASASEVVVESLDYGDDVQVLQVEGDEGAVMIWVDEEA